MSIWQFMAQWHGYVEANSPKEGAKLSSAEIDELADGLEDFDVATASRQTPFYVWTGLAFEIGGYATIT